jgi:hypothetical protein
MKEHNLKHNSNWKTEMLMLLKQINASPVDEDALIAFKDTVKELDQKRNKQIANYIPNFHKYI